MKLIKKLLLGLLAAAPLAAGAQSAVAPNLALAAATEYRERAVFPEWSFPVRDAVDPVTSGRIASRQRMSGPEGQAPALETWVDQVAYEAGEEVRLYARLDWNGAKALSALQNLRSGPLSGWEITGQVVLADVGTLADVVYADDGKGADARAADGIYTTRITLDEAVAPAVGSARSVMVKLHAENAKGEVRKALGGFQYSNPGAHLTGRYRSSIDDGNLLLLAEAEVLASGRYHLSGTLNGVQGAPVATAQNAAHLEPGKQWVALPFYGLIFHQLADASGLSLGSITLASVSSMPNALGPVLHPRHDLGTVQLDQLTRVPFNDAALLDAAQRLEAQLGDKLKGTVSALAN